MARRRDGSNARSLNDAIAAVARSFVVPARVRFRCECGQAACAATLPLRVQDYDAVRRRGGSVVVDDPGGAAAPSSASTLSA